MTESIGTLVHAWALKVDQHVLDDLHERLRRTRWTDSIEGSGYAFGFDVNYLKQLAEYWLEEYDWRTQEDMLNRTLPGYVATVRGRRVHFARLNGVGPHPIPLVVTHGWPGSVFEFYKIAPALADPGRFGADPRDAFDLIMPSIPGHGFSDPPTISGHGADEAADDIYTLVHDVLGIDRFGCQGGDRGAFVSMALGHRYRSNVIGLHLNMASGLVDRSQELSAEEQRWLDDEAAWLAHEGAYSVIQGARPQTLGVALNDSPVGLLAWIVEKWRSWSDCGGDVESVFTKDELITNTMIYWVTGTIRSSMQFYLEHRLRPPTGRQPVRIDVPTGVIIFPYEVSRPPRSAVERRYDLRRYTVANRGGHFAAMECPGELATDVRSFFRTLRDEAV